MAATGLTAMTTAELSVGLGVVGWVGESPVSLYWTSWPIFSSRVIWRRRALTRASILGSASWGLEGWGCWAAIAREKAQLAMMSE